MEHSSLPWRPGHLLDDNHTCNCRYIFANEDRMGAVGEVYIDDGKNDCPSVEAAKENLRFIVCAVNCHEELLAAAKTAYQFLETHYFGEHSMCLALRSAIKKAER